MFGGLTIALRSNRVVLGADAEDSIPWLQIARGQRFFVATRSDAGKLVTATLSELIGLEEFVAGGDEHSAVKRRALAEATKRHAQLTEEEKRDIIRTKIMNTVVFYWLRYRRKFPWSLLPAVANRDRLLINHVENEFILTQKHHLVANLQHHWGNRYAEIHPITFIVARKASASPSACKRSDYVWPPGFDGNCVRHARFRGASGSVGNDKQVGDQNGDQRRAVWIVKPALGSCGVGVFLHRGSTLRAMARALGEQYKQEKEKETESRAPSAKFVVQQYVDNPFCYRGRKFDIRVYTLIVPATPFTAFYHPGYIRIGGSDYESNRYNFDNQSAHITNFHVQRQHEAYDESTDSVNGVPVRASMQELVKHIVKHANSRMRRRLLCDDDEKLWDEESVGRALDQNIAQVVKRAVESVRKPLMSSSNLTAGQYALLGVDMLLGDTGKLHLIEFTKSPAYRMSEDYLRRVHSNLLGEMVHIVLEIAGLRTLNKFNEDSDTFQIRNLQSWKMIIPHSQ